MRAHFGLKRRVVESKRKKERVESSFAFAEKKEKKEFFFAESKGKGERNQES